MSKQIVISGNRILAYGEDCFLAMGGTVICPDTGRVYQNATVATVDALPADIDSVGYEYHAGDFVPCAPFGEGNGNIAVFCPESCNALKNSGIPLDGITHHEILTYTGNATYGAKNPTVLTFNIIPSFVFISVEGLNYWGWIMGDRGISVDVTNVKIEKLTASTDGKTLSFYHTTSSNFQLNTVREYKAIAFGKRSEG